jgi:CRP/FNR family transcriptional regulator, cyclic AMP receptor protein
MGVSARFAAPTDCQNCSFRKSGDFCQLHSPLLDRFNAIGHVTLYPANVPLVREGEFPRGVQIVCTGRVKMSIETRDKRTVILKIAGDRYVLGLSAIVSGRPAPLTVTTVDVCQINFIERDSFLQLLESDSRMKIACAAILAREISTTFDDVHELLLARSSTEKLARLLLSWVATQTHNRDLRVTSEFTHEEMAQMIGSSRETVTRLLCEMKKKELIRIEGSTLVIPNRVALQAIA